MTTASFDGAADYKWTKDSTVNINMKIQIEDGTIPPHMKGSQIFELANSQKKEHAPFRIYKDYTVAVISKHLRDLRKDGNKFTLLVFFN
jgi:hypothetical protein